MIGEDWNSPMYDHKRAMGWGYVIFFIGWFIIGNIILLNMFLAILLKNFSEPLNEEEEDDGGKPPVKVQDEKTSSVGWRSSLYSYLCCCCGFQV